MTRKINSINLRLGLLQVWSTMLNCYGKNLQPYQFFWFRMCLCNYLSRFLVTKKLVLGNLYLTFKSNKVLLIISYINFLNLNVSSYKLHNLLYKALKLWIINIPIYVYIFELNKPNLANFISLCFYYNLGNVTLKTILKTIQLNTKKVIMSSKGPVLLVLNGLKIKYSGRIDSSRNPMSKTLKLMLGSVSLSSIENYIDYTHKVIYTKLGTCSIHVWVSYSVLLVK